MPPDLSSARMVLAAGDTVAARQLLTAVVRSGQADGETWHLLSQTVDDPAQRADCERRAAAAGWRPAAPQVPKQPEPPTPKIEPVVAPPQPAPSTAAPASRLASIPIPAASNAPIGPIPQVSPARKQSGGRVLVGSIVAVLLLIALAGGIYLQRGGGSSLAVLAVATPTAAATPTPASCLDQSGAWIAQIDPLLKEWQDARRLASLTARVSLQPAVAKLQELKRTADATTPPECAVEAKRRLLVSMDSTIRGFEAFMLKFDLVSEDEIKAADTAYGTFERAYERLKAGEPILTPTNTPTS